MAQPVERKAVARGANTPPFAIRPAKDGAPDLGCTRRRCDEWLVAGGWGWRGAGDGLGARWRDGVDGGAAVAGGIDGAHAENDVVFGYWYRDGGDVAGGDDAGPVGLVGVAIDHLEGGAGGGACGLLPA